MANYYSTGIAILDCMLGFEKNHKIQTGLRSGSSLLIRGEPGAGKSTLALQIMSNILVNDAEVNASLYSLEMAPDSLMDKVKKDYGFFRTVSPDRIHVYSKNDILVDRLYIRALLTADDTTIQSSTRFHPYSYFFNIKEFGKPYPSRPEQSTTALTRASEMDIIVIDSLNAFIDLLKSQDPQRSSRQILNSLYTHFKKSHGKAIIIFTSEYHFNRQTQTEEPPESFICDTEIILFNQPIAVPASYDMSGNDSLGYEILKILDPLSEGESNKIESRSFLKVMKSRYSANQSRRCAYDILHDAGFKMFETFPGDGHIMLFRENEPQQQIWDRFYQQDLPHLFPAIRYENFDRKSLQRTFVNQRRLDYIPARTDMYLSSFDNYWINWNVENSNKIEIARLFKKLFHLGDEQALTNEEKRQFISVVNQIHRDLYEAHEPFQKIEGLVDDFCRKVEQALTGPDKSGMTPAQQLFFVRDGNARLAESNPELWNRVLQHHILLLPEIRSNLLSDIMTAMREGPIINCVACHWGMRLGREFYEDFRTDQKIIKDFDKILTDIFALADEERGRKVKIINAIKAYIIHRKRRLENHSHFSADFIWEGLSGLTTSRKIIPRLRGWLQMYTRYRHVEHGYLSEFIEKIFNLKVQLDNNRALQEKWRIGKDKLDASFAGLNLIFSNAEITRAKQDASRKKIRRDIRPNKRMNPGTNERRSTPSTWMKELLSKIKPNWKNSDMTCASEGKQDHYLSKLRDMLLESVESANNLTPEKITDHGSKCVWRNIVEWIFIYYQKEIFTNFFYFMNLQIDSTGNRRTTIPRKEGTGAEGAFREILNDWATLNLYEFTVCVENAKGGLLNEWPLLAVRSRMMELVFTLISEASEKHLLYEIPSNRLQLFGSAKSRIIHELESSQRQSKRPIHRPKELYSVPRMDRIISIPYDANISFMLRRTDKDKALNEFLAKSPKFRKRYLTNFDKILKPLKDMKTPKNKPINLTIKEISGRWESIIALLITIREFKKTITKEMSCHFVMETMTTDTLLCTFLELLWNCGGELAITPDYKFMIGDRDIEREAKTSVGYALYLLAIMFNQDIIPLNSTLEVPGFSGQWGQKGKQDWLFMRHWYSTLIDMLSLRDEIKKSKEFYWLPDPEVRLEILPIPTSVCAPGEPRHISCWGDWHFGIIRGSENVELGIEIINNLMSSQKIRDRALECASLPTVEEFYTLYGDQNCFNLPERVQQNPDLLPRYSYNDLRRDLFVNAKSRSEIFDYERCMLEFHSLIRQIEQLARSGIDDLRNKDFYDHIAACVDRTFDRIKSFAEFGQPIP